MRSPGFTADSSRYCSAGRCLLAAGVFSESEAVYLAGPCIGIWFDDEPSPCTIY